MAGAGSILELHVLSFGLAALMASSFIWLAFKSSKTPLTLRMALLHLGLLFLVNLFIFTTYIITEIPDFFGASEATVAALKGCSNLLNVLTILQIGFIFTIFPSPIFSNRKTTFGIGIFLVIILVIVFLIVTWLSLSIYSGYFVWLLVALTINGFGSFFMVRWYLLYRSSEDQILRNQAIAAPLLMLGLLGGNTIKWPSLLLLGGPELFFQGTYLALGDGLPLFVLLMNSTAIIMPVCALVVVLAKESTIQSELRDRSLLFTSVAFMLFGFLNLLILSLADSDGDFRSLWDYFAVIGMFGLVRPLILIYVALRFNLFDINNPQIRGKVRIIALLLVTVWTSSFFEIIQAFIPLPQLLSAALIGVVLAFAIGWEEKIFEGLASGGKKQMLLSEDDYFEKDDLFRSVMIIFGAVILYLCLGFISGSEI